MRRLAAIAALCGALGAPLVVTLLVGAIPSAAAMPAGAQPTPVRRLLVISIPVLTWEDVNSHAMPNLNRLLDRSAIASLATRTVTRTLDLTDGYVTMGAGTRAVGAGNELDGQAFGVDERVGDSTGGEMFARRTGEVVDHGLVHLGVAAIERRNDSELYDAQVGALGDALAASGHSRAVIGNADGFDGSDTPDDVYRRPAVAGLMGTDGTVPRGVIDDRLLVADTRAPFGLRLDTRAVSRALSRAWQPKSVVLVEASDLVREDLYRRFASADERPLLFRRSLQYTDQLVGALLEHVDFDRDAVMVVGPAHAQSKVGLTLMGLRAPGVEPGLLRSGTTHLPGFVELVDVAPTILDQIGLEQPDVMEGRPAEFANTGGSATERRQLLEDSDAAARFRDDQVAAVAVIMVVVAGLLAASVIVFLLRPELSWFPRVLYAGALAYLGYIPAVFLARLFPFYALGVIPYYVFLFGIAIALSLLYESCRRQNALDPLILALSVIVVLLLIDTIAGAPLQFNSALGYSPKVAGRFTGLGNLGYAALTAAAVILAGLLAHRIGGRRGARIAVGLLVVVFLIDGTPFLGADVGGILSVLPAYAVTAYLLLDLRVRLRAVVLWLGATVAAVIAFGLLDLSRPSDQRSHLGRLFEDIGSDGWSGFQTVVQRKLDTNLASIGNSVWLWMLPMVLGFVVFLVVRERNRWDAIFERVPELRATIVGFVVLAILGWALNDSGVAVPGMMLGIANAVLVSLVTWTVVDRAPAPPTRAPPDSDARGEPVPVGSRR